MGVDRDQADRFFRGDRSEPLLHPAGCETESAGADQVDADKIAVLGAIAVGLRDIQFAASLLAVDRDQPSAAIRQFAENAEQARPGVVDDLDDAAAIGRAIAFFDLLDPHQRAVADAGHRACLRTSRDMDADLRRGAVFLFIPFGRRGQELAIGIAAGDVDDDVGGSSAGSCTLRRRLAIVPSSARSRRMRFSSTRSAFFRPNSRAISRVPTLPGCARIKATMASRLGKTLSRCFATYPLALSAGFAGALLRDRFRGFRR